MKKEKNKEKKINIGILIFRIISIIIIIICLILLYNWNLENTQNSEIAENLSDSFITGVTQAVTTTENEPSNNTYDSLEINFDELLSQNENTIGWIKVNNTNINFPILKSSDNSFYLTHNFNKKYNSAGWIFADYRNNFEPLDKNTIIYGHNRRNNTMFSNLKYFLNPEWFNEESNKYFTFYTKDTNYVAKIFSVYKINQNALSLSNTFEDNDSYNNFINDCISKSIYNFDVNVSDEDNIITLCTCDNNTQYRIVIHGKLIPIE